MGNITKVIVTDSFGFVARSLWFCCPNFIPKEKIVIQTLGNEPKGIGNDDLGYVSQIFLPKTMGNDTVPCGFVYVIVPIVIIFVKFLSYSLSLPRDFPLVSITSYYFKNSF